MKTYKFLFNEMIARSNVDGAVTDALANKSVELKMKYLYSDEREKLIDEAIYYMHVPKPFEAQTCVINEGISVKKTRVIQIPSLLEQVIHHAIIRVLQPILMKDIFRHVYGSIPGRGAHDAKRHIEKWIKRGKGVKYCLKMDIRKFFPSINIKILKKFLKNKIKDCNFLRVVNCILDSSVQGLPIGFYTSQWFANWYLFSLDRYIKEELKVKHYVRYMDDMVIFSSNKRKLHYIKEQIHKFLNERLDLSLKDNWQVFRFDYISRKDGIRKGRSLDFLGFVFYRNDTKIRKCILRRSSRIAHTCVKINFISQHNAYRLVSYYGWYKHSKSRSMYKVVYGKIGGMKNLKKIIRMTTMNMRLT